MIEAYLSYIATVLVTAFICALMAMASDLEKSGMCRCPAEFGGMLFVLVLVLTGMLGVLYAGHCFWGAT